MRVGRSFTFVTKQPYGLKRHLAGTLIMLVPLVGWIPAAGYPIRLLERVRQGDEELPPWDRWGDLVIKGLAFWLAWFTYNIPSFVLNQFGGGFALLSPGTLWSVIVVFVLPAGIVNYVRSGRIAGLYALGAMLDFIRDNLVPYLLAWLATLAAFGFAFAGLAATLDTAADRSGLLGLVSFVLVMFLVFWAALAAAHMFGTIARDDAGRVRRID